MKVPAVVHKPESLYFEESERQWVSLKWALIRTSMQEADQAVHKWRKLSAEINDLLDRQNITDVVQRAHIRGDNLALGDYISTSTWFRTEAQAHMDDLNTFLKAKELGLF